MKNSLLTALLVMTSLAIACGDDSGTSGNNIIPNPNQDMGQAEDTGGMDAGGEVDMGEEVDMASADMGPDMEITACDLIDCEPSQDCIEGQCIDRDPCAEALDAGTLIPGGTPTTIESSFLVDASDAATSSCGNSGQLERLIEFELTEQAEVSWTAQWGEQFDGLVALQTACDDVETELTCSDTETGSAVLDPGTYFLVLEVRLGNPGDFSLQLSASEPPICQAGTATCSGDTRVLCVDGTETSDETCPTTCSSGTCAGNSCSNAITVTAPGGTFTGTGQAMTSTLDYDGNVDCAQIGGMSTSTPGYDVVFFLPGLTAGQVVSIDSMTNDGNVNDIFVQQTCGDTNQCVASYQNGEQPDFVVQTSGDYFVIVEKRQASNAAFEYSIAIQ